MTNQLVQLKRRDGSSAFPKSETSFDEMLSGHAIALRTAKTEILQVNVGKLCNQACKHCHVDASPTRTEIIKRETVDACLAFLENNRVTTLDLTGGAPELIPDFRYFVETARRLGVHTIVRHNLTVMFEEGQEDLPEFFAKNQVEVVSSLPYFQESRTDAQRGDGVFEKSIAALKRLNAVGYGLPDVKLKLNLVYNPVGAFLPPEQGLIESDFKKELAQRYGIEFTGLFTITNMPIARYLDWLRRSGNEHAYMKKLVNAFNVGTVEGLMCRNTLSVDWKGNLFDCDFNQMLGLGVKSEVNTVFSATSEQLEGREIAIRDHCFGCTAGSGSSCGGAVTE